MSKKMNLSRLKTYFSLGHFGNYDTCEVVVSLPGILRAGLGNQVNIELDTDKPYSHKKTGGKRRCCG